MVPRGALAAQRRAATGRAALLSNDATNDTPVGDWAHDYIKWIGRLNQRFANVLLGGALAAAAAALIERDAPVSAHSPPLRLPPQRVAKHFREEGPALLDQVLVTQYTPHGCLVKYAVSMYLEARSE